MEARFARFSNSELLTKANRQAMLAQLRCSELTAIRRVVELIDRYAAGLEQGSLVDSLLTVTPTRHSQAVIGWRPMAAVTLGKWRDFVADTVPLVSGVSA
jgi:hypothetical protein